MKTLLAAAVLAQGEIPMEANAVPAADPKIHYGGRVVADAGTVTLAYPGTEVIVRFTGSSLRLRGQFEGEFGAFNREVDGKPQPRLEAKNGAFEWVLADKLAAGSEHTVRLVRRNEVWQGVPVLESFVLAEGGELLAVEDTRSRRMLCLGDSITCGDHIEFLPPYSAESPATWNTELTYAWLLAKKFDAQIQFASYGGKGIVRDWSGDTEEVKAHEIFERAHPDMPELLWDHGSYTPDLVTICFGTNDYSSGMLDDAAFTEPYIALVERVHEVHPEAQVLLISSPMLPGYKPEAAKAVERCLSAIKSHFEAAGEAFVENYLMPDYSGTEWNAHPVVPQHAAMAEDLAPVIAERLGWSTAVPPCCRR